MATQQEQPQTWQTKAAAKRQQQLSHIPPHLRLKETRPVNEESDVSQFDMTPYLSDIEIAITETKDVGVLLEHLKTGKWTSMQVTQAFCSRALVAQQLVNCLTEVFTEQALQRAQELDNHLKSTGEPIGPLHGLPISLKDQIDLEGVELTMGYIGWIGNVSKKNAALADILLKQGAVFFVRTNVPQSLMIGETLNNVFGTTCNPFNRSLTCGGSSGGEGALVGMRGSPLGVGSDVGGSIRIPSAYQGLYGLRPSYNRVPYCGASNTMEGQEAIPSVLGPISSSLNGLKIFLKAVLDGKPWSVDPIALRLPWNEGEYNLESHGKSGKGLCFAIMYDDGVCKPIPPYKRALDEAKSALELAGHKVIEWEPLDNEEGGSILLELFNADGGEDIDAACALSGEPRIKTVLTEGGKHLSTFEYWQLCKRRAAHIKRQLDHWELTALRTGTGRPVDAIIAPAGGTGPVPHGQDQYIYYTAMCNLMDWTAAVFPMTEIDPLKDPKKSKEARNEVEKKIHDLYNAELMKGGKIGLQCIGRKQEEEAVIRMTEIVDAAVHLARKKK